MNISGTCVQDCDFEALRRDVMWCDVPRGPAAPHVVIGEETPDLQPAADKSGDLNIYKNEGSQRHLQIY